MQRLLAVLCLLTGTVFSPAHAQRLPAVQYANGVPQCPSDTDLRNIDTRLSALVVPTQNAATLRNERAKALRCRVQGGSYTDNDWKRMRAALRGDE